MRLIDADEAKKLNKEQCVGDCGCCSDLQDDNTCTLIDRVPTVDDAVIVVRCKDCKHRTEAGNCGHPRHHGILPSAYPYDFCSYGEYQTNTGGVTK